MNELHFRSSRGHFHRLLTPQLAWIRSLAFLEVLAGFQGAHALLAPWGPFL